MDYLLATNKSMFHPGRCADVLVNGKVIGRIGEDLIYYLSSRGMKEEEIYKMIAQGRLMTTIHLIENEEIRKELTELVLGKEEE